MKLISIKEALALDPGDPISGVKGKILDVYEFKTGNKGDKDWSVQNIMIQDRTGKVKVVLWNQQEIRKSSKGREIFILTGRHSKTNKPIGLEMEEQEYQGKTYTNIKASDSAEVGFEEGGGNSDPDDDESTKGQQSDQSSDGLRFGRHKAAQFANGYLLVLQASSHIAKIAEENGIPISDAHFQAMNHTIFIAMDKSGAMDGLPVKPIDFKPVSRPKLQPEPEPDWSDTEPNPQDARGTNRAADVEDDDTIPF